MCPSFDLFRPLPFHASFAYQQNHPRSSPRYFWHLGTSPWPFISSQAKPVSMYCTILYVHTRARKISLTHVHLPASPHGYSRLGNSAQLWNGSIWKRTGSGMSNFPKRKFRSDQTMEPPSTPKIDTGRWRSVWRRRCYGHFYPLRWSDDDSTR